MSSYIWHVPTRDWSTRTQRNLLRLVQTEENCTDCFDHVLDADAVKHALSLVVKCITNVSER